MVAGDGGEGHGQEVLAVLQGEALARSVQMERPPGQLGDGLVQHPSELGQVVPAVGDGQQDTAGPQDAAELQRRPLDVGHVVEHVVGHRRSGRGGGQGERLGVGLQHGAGEAGLAQTEEHPPRQVEGHSPPLGKGRQVLAVAGADVHDGLAQSLGPAHQREQPLGDRLLLGLGEAVELLAVGQQVAGSVADGREVPSVGAGVGAGVVTRSR